MLTRVALLFSLVVIPQLCLGCGQASSQKVDGVAPAEYWQKTGDPTIDYWNLINRAWYGYDKLPPHLGEEECCRDLVAVVRMHPKSDIDRDLIDWAEALANWYSIRADILKMRNDPGFYPQGIREKEAGRSPTIVEENEKLLVDWEVGFQSIRSDGIHLRAKLGATYKKYFPPCLLRGPR